MSLTLLPAVDVRDGKAVRLRQGESGSETDYGSPLEAARTWVESGAEWIHLVDLDAAFGTGNNRDQLRAIVKELGDKVNIEMSGGVRDDASLDAALEAGAARVNIGTAALENPDWTASVIKKYGDRVAVGLDVRGHTLAARGWVKEGGDLFETMAFLDSVGCSRYVVTDVARVRTSICCVRLRNALMRRSPRPVAFPSSMTCAPSRNLPIWAWIPRFSANRCMRAPSLWKRRLKSHVEHCSQTHDDTAVHNVDGLVIFGAC